MEANRLGAARRVLERRLAITGLEADRRVVRYMVIIRLKDLKKKKRKSASSKSRHGGGIGQQNQWSCSN